ncbi:ATP-binding protein [Maricaulis sp. CAU 1757]
MFWTRIDRLTGANPLVDLDHAIKSRLAVAYTAVFTLMGTVNALILTFIVDARPGLAELAIGSGVFAGVVGSIGLWMRKPNLTIAAMLVMAALTLFSAAIGNHGSFPPSSIYLPGIVLGAYIAWGARAALMSIIPVFAYFGFILSMAGEAKGSLSEFTPEEMLNVLVIASGLSCVWIILFGSSFRSATNDAREAMAQNNRKLEEALITAEQANRAKSDFISNMGHEVRTPLNGVLGMTSILQQDDRLTEDQKRHIALIEASGRALHGLLNEVLDLSKIEADAIELEHQTFDLVELVQQATDHWRPQAESKGIVLECGRPGLAKAEVTGDALRVKQVVNSLLSNAVKFTHGGRITVSLGIDTVNDGDDFDVSLTIKDTGIGIPFDKQNEIFEPFNQVDSSTTRKYGGTGLGLAISHRLVHKMGGEISCLSTPGRGSTFTLDLRLPRADGAAPLVQEPVYERTELPDAQILIVDDVQTNLQVMQAMVQQAYAGQEVSIDCAVSGREAVNRASARPYDIILMDIQMPEMDGISTMHCIRETRKSRDAKIIAVTALASDDNRKRFLAEGFDAYLPKPIDIGTLTRMLDTVSRTPRSAEVLPLRSQAS